MNERFEDVGTVHIGMTVKNVRIDEIQLSGDFFGVNDIKEIEQALKGVKLRKEEIEQALKSVKLRKEDIEEPYLRMMFQIILLEWKQTNLSNSYWKFQNKSVSN